jgi:hypothetical protein
LRLLCLLQAALDTLLNCCLPVWLIWLLLVLLLDTAAFKLLLLLLLLLLLRGPCHSQPCLDPPEPCIRLCQ